MQKKISGMILVMASVLLVSCASSIKFNKSNVAQYNSQLFANDSEMAFIGIKADNTLLSRDDYDQWQKFMNVDSLRQIGAKLQSNNIADDQSHAYFGLYSLQEIKEFKTDKRYLTFIEVSRHHITYQDSGDTFAIAMGGIGGTAAGIGLGIIYLYPEAGTGFLLTGALISLIGLIPRGSTVIGADGEYNIYVYDRDEARIFSRETVYVNVSDKYTGQFSLTSDADKDKIVDYYASIISNEILKKYDDVQRWIMNHH